MREVGRAFRAMNTDVQALIVCVAERQHAAEALLDAIERRFELAEETLSRFRSKSELSALNASAGQPFHASSLLFSVVSEAIAAARLTHGLFDPAILPMLVAAGYDRSFEELEGERPRLHPCPVQAGGWAEIELDPKFGTILLPPGVQLDLGGIGKGWTTDRAAETMRPWQNFALDAGGDIAVGGHQADGSPWTVGVEDPLDLDRDLVQVGLTDCAIATSTVARRRWRKGGREQHHLIDPRTGQPAQTGVLAATVIAETVARAETLAKAALLLGPKAGVDFLDALEHAEGMLVLDGDRTELTAGFEGLRHVA